jgi:8-oxo-dGTP pyrophosphatase MutT (NUDIX family)
MRCSILSRPVSEIEITCERPVYENGYGVLYDDEVLFQPQGKAGTYVRWKWKIPYSVAILPFISADEVLLIESFRHSARKPVIEVPKGFGVIDKDPVESASEELRQEVGLSCKQLEYAGKTAVDLAFMYHPIYLFFARDCTPAPGDNRPEASEVIIRKAPVRLAEIPTLLADDSIEDTVTQLMLLQAYVREFG